MSIFSRFAGEESGQALALFVVSMPAFVGLSLLAIDIGRGNNLYYDLQKGVDSLALTAAAELDGSPDAITRADAAVSGELLNRTRFADDNDPYLGLDLSNVTVTYLCEIPASDDDPIDTRDCNNGGDVTTDPLRAVFAWVQARGTNALDYTTIFPVTLASGSDTVRVGAEAVAGYEQVVCKATPLFMCNPWDRGEADDDPMKLYDLIDTNKRGNGYGRMLTFRTSGGGNQPFAGNFGFLRDPNRGPGAAVLRETFANIYGQGCFRSRGVDTEPGFKETISDAINVRLDIYAGAVKNYKNQSQYRPATNVRKGAQRGGDQCEPTLTSDPQTDGVMGFPKDQAESWDSTQGGAIGNGVWDFEGYAEINYPQYNTVDSSTGEVTGNTWADNVKSHYGITDPNLTPTRNEVYQYEIDPDENDVVNMTDSESIGPDGVVASGDGELGAPQCNTTGMGVNDPPRRSIYGAVVNCDDYLKAGGKSGGYLENVPVFRWVEFFLARPLQKNGGDPDAGQLFVEVINIFDKSNNNSFQRNESVLYR